MNSQEVSWSSRSSITLLEKKKKNQQNHKENTEFFLKKSVSNYLLLKNFKQK